MKTEKKIPERSRSVLGRFYCSYISDKYSWRLSTFSRICASYSCFEFTHLRPFRPSVGPIDPHFLIVADREYPNASRNISGKTRLCCILYVNVPIPPSAPRSLELTHLLCSPLRLLFLLRVLISKHGA